jgi:hypothetical protein
MYPVGTKPMLPAGSYVTSLGGLYVAMHDVQDGVKRKQSQSALHSTWRMEDVMLSSSNQCNQSIIIVLNSLLIVLPERAP